MLQVEEVAEAAVRHRTMAAADMTAVAAEVEVITAVAAEVERVEMRHPLNTMGSQYRGARRLSRWVVLVVFWAAVRQVLAMVLTVLSAEAPRKTWVHVPEAPCCSRISFKPTTVVTRATE